MKNHSHLAYVLITSLYYPAILGTLIYTMLNSIATFDTVNFSKNVIMIVASIGIVVSFTIDYLYTVSFKHSYSIKLFIFDIVILYLLLIAYNTLLHSIMVSNNFSNFFVFYSLIHIVFLGWDILMLEKSERSWPIIAYDATGIILSVVGYFCFRYDSFAAVCLLWVTTSFYFILSKDAIFPRLINMKDS
jgi:hypothetical protein